MSSEDKQGHELQIAHVLFMDIVGYSKLSINLQGELTQQLNQIVRSTEQFHRAEAGDKLVRLPTGDGMALVFFTSPDAPVRCAIEISEVLGQARAVAGEKRQAEALALQLRMGINSGPVDAVADVNDRSNVAGAGINMAQRVMDCGDAGHILLSKRVADDLSQYEEWQPYLHELGLVEVKHGIRVEMVNFYNDKVGNAELPEKIKHTREELSTLDQRASRLAARKRSLIIVSLLVIIVGIAGSWLLFHRIASHPTNPASLLVLDKSIAVLPLENLSDEKENAYFADGIQDELLSNLSKIKGLKVISRTSVMQYKTNITRNLTEIAQQLGVANVVEGSVRRSGNHVRVSVQLIDALNDRHIWAQNYDRTLADSLALQGELATQIAAEVGAALSPQEKARVEATPTQNTSAYEAYLQGRALAAGSALNKPKTEAAIRSFQEAVKLDPKFTLAWAFLSRVQMDMFWDEFDPTPARLAAAKDALDHAVALDPALPETHLAVGFYRYRGERDFTGALKEFLIAEQGLPNDVDVVFAIGLIQRRLAHWNEAIAAMRRRVELDPGNMSAAVALASTLMMIRSYSDAARVADHILAIEPGNSRAIAIKLYTLWAKGESAQADSLLKQPGVDVDLLAEDAMHKRRFKEAISLLSKPSPGESDIEKTGRLLYLALAQQRGGDTAAARATYQEVVQIVTHQLEQATPDSAPAADLHSALGIAYAGLGEADSAIAEGEKGIALQPSSQDPMSGPEREEAMAGIYAMLGDADHAIPILQRLVKIPSGTEIVPWHLRLDPTWDPIRNDPRFQELAAEKNP